MPGLAWRLLIRMETKLNQSKKMVELIKKVLEVYAVEPNREIQVLKS